jgi:predicted dehydrogenase
MIFRRARSLESISHAHAVLFNHGVHHIDIIRSVTSAVPARIHAVEWDPPGTPPGKGAMLRLTAHTTEGFIVSYDASYAETGAETPHTGRLRLSGSRGALEAYGQVEQPRLRLTRNEQVHGQQTDEQIPLPAGSWGAVDRRLLEAFAQAARTGRPFETDVEDNLQTLEWLFRAAECLDRKTSSR